MQKHLGFPDAALRVLGMSQLTQRRDGDFSGEDGRLMARRDIFPLIYVHENGMFTKNEHYEMVNIIWQLIKMKE